MSADAKPRPAIHVRQLGHRFGPHEALRGVSFDVAPGEIVGIIGPNGAGKTTTIRVMTTLLEPTSGRVEIEGLDVSVDPERVRRLIGYMPDHPGVYEQVTVREYLEFFADAYDVSGGGRDYAAVEAVLELTDLTRLEDKLVAALSKGMQQRLQLGRVLLHDPRVLILDEPASDLDPRARIEMRDLLVELRAMGKTIFLSSHILTELADVCTSVAILERGSLVVAGPIAEIADRLAAARAAPDDLRCALPPEAPRCTRCTLRLRVRGDDAAVARALVGAAFVSKVGPGPAGSVSVTYFGRDSEVEEIVRRLVAAGVGVLGVEPERSELERIFLEVTRGDLQ